MSNLIHAAVFALLEQSSALTTIVGTRIYPDVMPDAPVFPAITYQKMAGASERGAVSDPPLLWAVFQVSAWSKTRLEAASITNLVRTALDRQRKVTIASVAIDDSFYEDDVDLYDSDARTYFNHCSFKFFYRDA